MAGTNHHGPVPVISDSTRQASRAYWHWHFPPCPSSIGFALVFPGHMMMWLLQFPPRHPTRSSSWMDHHWPRYVQPFAYWKQLWEWSRGQWRSNSSRGTVSIVSLEEHPSCSNTLFSAIFCRLPVGELLLAWATHQEPIGTGTMPGGGEKSWEICPPCSIFHCFAWSNQFQTPKAAAAAEAHAGGSSGCGEGKNCHWSSRK